MYSTQYYRIVTFLINMFWLITGGLGGQGGYAAVIAKDNLEKELKNELPLMIEQLKRDAEL